MTRSFAHWRFREEWRHYQQLCLDAFEADREAGRHQTLLVAPPGSGKTIVGLEVVRRLGLPALVLCPTQTIQRQWSERQALFGEPDSHLQVMTYQALCQADDPDQMLRRAAERRWAYERSQATGQAVDEVEREIRGWTGAAQARRERELTRMVASLKREAAAGKLPELGADQLLAPTARARLEELIVAGVDVVVLDECHHLASLWGALLAQLLHELTPVHVIGLTATSPKDLTEEQATLYRRLLDEEDFSIPTPAVVREGHLAPYQELVQLCQPLASERDWLDERHQRFEELLVELDDLPPGREDLGLSAWLVARLFERSRAGGGAVSWPEFARRQPRLANAGLRWLHHAGKPPPPDAPRGERHRAPLDIEDWVVLLDDYAMRCLRPRPESEAAERLQELQVALGELGYTVTRRGIRRTGGEVDRVLLNSAAKPLEMCNALGAELESRGLDLRAVVLCDSERPPRQAADSPLSLMGGGRGLLVAAGADHRVSWLHPLLITGETFAVLPDEVDWWRAELAAQARADGAGLERDGFTAEVHDDGVAVLSHRDGGFTSRQWTEWATRLLRAGRSKLLIGTRGLLGEGWDCPELNVLVDMTAVAADISVRQMRGRSLRLDPGDPHKLASNWDVVCVAPDLGRGHADYFRFVRRHLHLHAPCEDGAIETGPSHVHPELSPYGPPAAERFAAINVEQRRRAQDREAARERWRIGEPYRGVDLDALVVRRPRAGEAPPRALPSPPRRRNWPLGVALTGAGTGVLAVAGVAMAAPAVAVAAALPAAAGIALAAHGVTTRPGLHPAELPLEWAAAAVCEAYVALGELSPEAAASLDFAPRPEGWVRVTLPEAGVEESRLVTTGLDELFGGGPLPRYVASRLAVPEGSRWGRPRAVWHPVPRDLGRNRDRADAFHAAWLRWCGPSELRYCHGSDEGLALAAAAAGGEAWETQRRRIWR